MSKLFSIGEALIDFIPEETGKEIKNISGFQPKCGGAPANVCGAFSKLGGESEMITKLGDDPFGDKLVDAFEKFSIGHQYVKRTDEANTALAFVSLKADGNREFSFYRNPSADMLLRPEEVKEEWFGDCGILHFCSVALAAEPMRSAHDKAIECARKNGAMISFDPNLRFPLWKDKQALRETVCAYIPKADIVKISDEELSFINGEEAGLEYSEQQTDEAIRKLFTGNVKLIVYTAGSKGAYAYTKNGKTFAASQKVDAVDTTGAGDGFIGSFLYQIHRDGIETEKLADTDLEVFKDYIAKSNDFCGKSVVVPGAIESYPTEI